MNTDASNAVAARDIAGMFDRTAQSYDAVGVDFFSVFANELLFDIGLLPGENVLDVGCGRGAVLFPAAEGVGKDGSVTGIDLSAEMISRTAADIERAGLPNVRVAVQDGQQPDQPSASFDVVLASCVVFFLPDPVSGLRAWHGLLRKGGRIGLTTFCGNDPRWSEVEKIFTPFVPPAIVLAIINPKSPFASNENFDRTMTEVGFSDISTVIREHEIAFTGPDQWISWSQSHGQRMFWELIPEEHLVRVTEEVLARLEELREPAGGLRMNQRVRYTVAKRHTE